MPQLLIIQLLMLLLTFLSITASTMMLLATAIATGTVTDLCLKKCGMGHGLHGGEFHPHTHVTSHTPHTHVTSHTPHTHVTSRTSHATGESFPLSIPCGSGIMAGAITRGWTQGARRRINGQGLLMSLSIMTKVMPLTTILGTTATRRWSWVREG